MCTRDRHEPDEKGDRTKSDDDFVSSGGAGGPKGTTSRIEEERVERRYERRWRNVEFQKLTEEGGSDVFACMT